MISFIIKLEDMLKAAGHENWEIMYVRDLGGYILKLDGDVVYMTDAKDLDISKDDRK